MFSRRSPVTARPSLHEARNLRPGPYVQPPVLQLDHRVHRFQRRVREIWHLVLGLDHAGARERRLHVAIVLEAAVLAMLAVNDAATVCEHAPRVDGG